MAKLLSDSHGVFAKVNGSVYRPQSSKFDKPHSKRVLESAFQPNDTIKTSKIIGTPFATITCNGIVEWWVTHGPFLGYGKAIPSERLWHPE